MSISRNTLISDAYAELNVYLPGENPTADDGALAARILGRMLGSWAQQRGTIPVVAREVFDLVANKGGPSNPYTIGIGGDFNTDRPPNQDDVRGATLLLTTSSPNVEVPLALLNDQQWQSIQVKDLANTQPTTVYYNQTYTLGFGTINLWPVPSVATNDLVLYLAKQIADFADGTTLYTFPPGYEDALVENLACRLATSAGRKLTDIPELAALAANSLALIKRTNTQPFDVAQDLMFGNQGLSNGGSGYGYNINTGQ